MRTVDFSGALAHYGGILDSVINDREEVVVTRPARDPVVLVALDEQRSLVEAAYLLRSPENARRLLASIDRLENGGVTPTQG